MPDHVILPDEKRFDSPRCTKEPKADFEAPMSLYDIGCDCAKVKVSGAKNPLDHPKDLDLRYNVPGDLRKEAKIQRALGNKQVAADMDAEANRVAAKRAALTPGQRAVLARSIAKRSHPLATIALVGIALGGVGYVASRRK